MKYTWVPFYMEFAKKLLKFRDNRKPLVDWIYSNIDASLIKHFKDAPDGRHVPDTDPFTVMAIINRGITWNKKIALCEQFSKFLTISTPVPQDFSGVPEMNNQKSNFMAFEDRRKEGDIERLWDVFEAAVEDMNIKSKYDALSNQFLIKFNLSIGLFWIRPDKFLSLDGNSQKLLEKNGITYDKTKFLPYDEYERVMKELKKKMQSEDWGFTNFVEFSYAAYNQKKQKSKNITKSLTNITKNDNNVNDTIEVNVVSKPKSTGKQYWWLTGSPKYWSPSKDWELGEDIDYTLYNDKGNKRRIFKHFMEAKPGDSVIVYESTPVLQIVAIGRVVSETDGEVLYIRKREELLSPVPYSEIFNNPMLKKSEPVMNRCQGSLFQLTQEEYDEIVRLIRKENPEPIIEEEEQTEEYTTYTDEDFLKEVYMDRYQLQTLKSLLNRKKNIILQGAPGVGKTFVAKRLAFAIIGEKDESRVKVIQFHQSYSYEDFVMGYKPNGDGGFSIVNGVFYDICQQARLHHDKLYFLIIDEINRGNMSKIFGELLQLIESDYRDTPIQLAYNKQRFSVPSNLYIIGMMNTADRSLAMIDYALRRRFSFYEMKPAFGNVSFKDYIAKKGDSQLNNLVKTIVELNKVIANDDSLGTGFCIGHSYLCNLERNNDIESIVEYDIIPMLREYWFDNDDRFNSEVQKLRNALK